MAAPIASCDEPAVILCSAGAKDDCPKTFAKAASTRIGTAGRADFNIILSLKLKDGFQKIGSHNINLYYVAGKMYILC
jgi:hypothetical protein